MQEGSRGTSKGLYICTDGFKHEDVKRLKECLRGRYEIKCSIHKVNGRYRIYIYAKSVEALRERIIPYMDRTMLYKLGV